MIRDGRFTPTAVKGLSGSSASDKGEEFSAHEERVFLALVAEGKTNKEIAAILRLSDKTVGHYLENISQKLHVSRRSQAAVYYTKQRSKQ